MQGGSTLKLFAFELINVYVPKGIFHDMVCRPTTLRRAPARCSPFEHTRSSVIAPGGLTQVIQET